MIERLDGLLPDRPGPAVLVGAGLLLAGLLLAMLLGAALAALLGTLGGHGGAGAFLPLLALPAFAVAACAWVVTIVSRVGLRASRPALGLASYLLLALPLGIVWLFPAARDSTAIPLSIALGAGLIPAYMGVQVAKAPADAARGKHPE